MFIVKNENNFILEFDEVNQVLNSEEITNKIIPDDFYENYYKYKYINEEFVFDDSYYNQQLLENKKQLLLKEISKCCENAIYNGIEIETTQGLERFSLTEKDQINISNCYNMALNNVQSILYHSNGNLCRVFSANEIITLTQKATEHITYHTTYCNHLNTWIRRCVSLEELNSIYYCVELPRDLQNNLNTLLGGQSNETTS